MGKGRDLKVPLLVVTFLNNFGLVFGYLGYVVGVQRSMIGSTRRASASKIPQLGKVFRAEVGFWS